LIFRHFSLRAVFWFAAIPGVLAMLALVAGVREPDRPPPSTAAAAEPPPAGGGFRAYLVAVGLFAVGNSTDAFLLLRAQSLGVGRPGGAARLIRLWPRHRPFRFARDLHDCGGAGDGCGANLGGVGAGASAFGLAAGEGASAGSMVGSSSMFGITTTSMRRLR